MADSGLEITEVRVTLLADHDHDRLKAFATMTLNRVFVVRGLKIIQGPNGIFVAMPSRRSPDGQFRDIAHPINNETRRLMEESILNEYQHEVQRQQER
jgi:stage V sporulation protein G